MNENQVNADGGCSIAPFKFKTVTEVFEAKEVETAYCVDGLLPTGGMSILAGKPKAGKTTLVRLLVVAVAKGEAFLGRSTQQGKVLYIALEEKESEVGAHFQLLGLSECDPVCIWTGSVQKSTAVASLQATLESTTGVSLVVIDPVFKFVSGVKDTNDYVQVNNALERLLELARQYSVHILLVHHMKKRETEDLGDSCLGSTAIAGAVDTFVALKADPRGMRTLESQQRYGEGMPETQLNWDADTRKLSLGSTVEQAQREAAKATSNRIENDVITYVVTHKGCTQEAIMEAVKGKSTTKKAIFRDLFDSGFFVQSGGGVKGDAYTYEAAEPPTETLP